MFIIAYFYKDQLYFSLNKLSINRSHLLCWASGLGSWLRYDPCLDEA